MNRSLPIIPFRIENVLPSRAIELFVAANQWLDAFTPPLEEHAERLADSIQRLIGKPAPQLAEPDPRDERRDDPGQRWSIHSVEAENGHTFAILPLRLGKRQGAWAIGATPVTNAQYRRFVEETGHRSPGGERFVGSKYFPWRGPFKPWRDDSFSNPLQPVVCVDFADATAYARWVRDRDGAMNITVAPTAVWDFAAYGSLNHRDRRLERREGRVHDRAGRPAPVTSRDDDANFFGVTDLFGNVWEWTSASLAPEPVLAAGRGDYWEPATEELRGGGYLDDLEAIRPQLKVRRIPGKLKCRHSDLGFRLAAEVSEDRLPSALLKRCSGWERLPADRASRNSRSVRNWASPVPASDCR